MSHEKLELVEPEWNRLHLAEDRDVTAANDPPHRPEGVVIDDGTWRHEDSHCPMKSDARLTGRLTTR